MKKIDKGGLDVGNKSFDVAFISDIHTDFHVPPNLSGYKLAKRIQNFIDEKLVLKEADILIFAGDNSHYPLQNKILLEQIVARKIYKKIFITYGNHDLYLISKNQKVNYVTSWEKLAQSKEMYSEIDTVEFLDGNIVEVDGVNVGGCSMWYDFSYAYKNFNYNKGQMIKLWKDVMNDADKIVGYDDLGYTGGGGWGMYSTERFRTFTFDPLKFFEEQKEKMLNIIENCDIFVSHIGPMVPPNLKINYHTPETGFYFFDGEQYLMRDKAPKLWCFGHTHDQFFWKHNKTILACNPLGYKHENLTAEIRVVDFYDLDNLFY